MVLLHVAPGAVSVLPAAVRGSGAGRAEDAGDPLETPAGPHGEPDSGGPHRQAGLGGGGMAGGAGRLSGDGPGPDPSSAPVRREAGPRGGRRWDQKSPRRIGRTEPDPCPCLSGLVDVGVTWQCPAGLQGEELQHLETSAVLTGLEHKHVTHLSNPRWLRGPLPTPGGRDLWTVEIPAELLP